VGDTWVAIVGEGEAIVTDGVETGGDGRIVGEGPVVIVGIDTAGEMAAGNSLGRAFCEPFVFFWIRKNKRIASIPVAMVRTSRSIVLKEELFCFFNFSRLISV